ncbi:hypothetical protein CU098_008033, partial [Rhizopus stolonifer]
GDTVPEESSAAKKQDIDATTVIGDKIDLRESIEGSKGQRRQIAGPAGQMLEVSLVDNGLYAASHLGSLRLPSTQMDLRYLRALLTAKFDFKGFKRVTEGIIYIRSISSALVIHKNNQAYSRVARQQNIQLRLYLDE